MSVVYSLRMKKRRLLTAVLAAAVAVMFLVINPESYDEIFELVENSGASSGVVENSGASDGAMLASEVLSELEVKGRAPKTGYKREEFYNGWPTVEGCSLRQRILKREFGDTAVLDGCIVVAGEFDEPYTGEHMIFKDKKEVSKVQIDHVVALSDAWLKGAQYLSSEV